ncbi:F0F1 ATP synthase subunit A [Nocardiopsis sp. MG754419]|uniref:F0F1 ATP synthase subunit A n=1 Tax=Nocardiopsis sp. MG754419 TaxID=2259865 RepID=UPI001BA58245|nr:F0F1 ATP synthase subunit A [Nocardiopsis sp. MG754419]MBR8740421.1 ATP synthase F0 subunit A [Nocardiopsis sp. MG754419]
MRILAAEPGCHLFGDNGCGFEAPTIGMFFPEPWFAGIPGSAGIDLYLVLLLVAVGAVLLLWSWFSKKLSLVPGRRQSVGEMLILFIRDNITRPTMGAKGDAFIPFMTGIFTLILAMNFTGLIPGMLPVNSNLAFTAMFALTIYVMTIVIGIKHQGGWGYFRNQIFPPGMPKWIYVLVTPIEILSVFLIRPVTHALRLFATMFAGSLLLAVFAYGGWYMLNLSAEPMLAAVSVVFSGAALLGYVAFFVFEIAIMLIQAFVFTLLASLYLNQSLEAAH